MPQPIGMFSFDWLFNRQPKEEQPGKYTPRFSTEKPDWMTTAGRNLEEQVASNGMALDWFKPSEDYGTWPNAAIDLTNRIVPNPLWYAQKGSNLVQSLAENIKSGFTPEKTLKTQESIANTERKTKRAIVSGEERRLADPNAEKVDSDGQVKIDVGTTFIPDKPPELASFNIPPPELMPMPEARPVQQPFDFQPYLNRMEEYRPQMEDRRTYMKDRLWQNVARALAAGASGSGWSGAAGALARAGASFGVQQADTGDEYLQQEKEFEQTNRLWELNRLNMEMRLKQEADNMAFQGQQTAWQSGEDARQVTIANNQAKYNAALKQAEIDHETEQQNLDRLYDYNNTVGQLTQSKVLHGTGKNVIAIQHTGADGESFITYKSLGGEELGNEDLNALQNAGEIWGTESDVYKRRLYLPLVRNNDIRGIKTEIAREVLRNVKVSEVFDEATEQDINERAEELVDQRGISLADPDDYSKALNDAKAHLLADKIDTNNQAQMEQLAQTAKSYGANIMLGSFKGGQR